MCTLCPSVALLWKWKRESVTLRMTSSAEDCPQYVITITVATAIVTTMQRLKVSKYYVLWMYYIVRFMFVYLNEMLVVDDKTAAYSVVFLCLQSCLLLIDQTLIKSIVFSQLPALSSPTSTSVLAPTRTKYSRLIRSECRHRRRPSLRSCAFW